MTQFALVSFPEGIAVHSSVLLTKASSAALPDEHHANVRSNAQNRPSLLAEVQRLGFPRAKFFSMGRYACSVNAWLSIASRLMFKAAQLDAASASEN